MRFMLLDINKRVLLTAEVAPVNKSLFKERYFPEPIFRKLFFGKIKFQSDIDSKLKKELKRILGSEPNDFAIDVVKKLIELYRESGKSLTDEDIKQAINADELYMQAEQKSI